jgi:hypothetical protein
MGFDLGDGRFAGKYFASSNTNFASTLKLGVRGVEDGYASSASFKRLLVQTVVFNLLAKYFPSPV